MIVTKIIIYASSNTRTTNFVIKTNASGYSSSISTGSVLGNWKLLHVERNTDRCFKPLARIYNKVALNHPKYYLCWTIEALVKKTRLSFPPDSCNWIICIAKFSSGDHENIQLMTLTFPAATDLVKKLLEELDKRLRVLNKRDMYLKILS